MAILPSRSSALLIRLGPPRADMLFPLASPGRAGHDADWMKRRRKLLLILAVLAAAVATTVFLASPRAPEEPVYQGKPLTQWLMEDTSSDDFLPRLESRAALDAIGTNALPFLMQEFARPVSGWKDRLRAWVNRRSRHSLRLRSDQLRLILATRGLSLLGTNAAGAIPGLIQQLGDPERGFRVARIMERVGDEAVPHLRSAIAATNLHAGSNAILALQLLSARSDAARQALTATPQHPDPGVRIRAVSAWISVLGFGGNVVDDLVALAKDPNPEVRRAASNHLVRLSVQAPARFRGTAEEALLTLRTNAPPPRAR